MSDPERRLREERVLVLAPTEKDGARSRALLGEAGMACTLCPDLEALCRELGAGAAAVVLTEEALVGAGLDCLAEALHKQPPWSDLPLLVLTAGGAGSGAAPAAEALGNVTLLEWPVRMATLVSAARSALRARRRQYQIREHLAERERVAELLRETDRRKDEFLAMLGHELRNPLAPVRNALYLLRARGGGDAEVEELAVMMERQVGHLVRLVDDLLDVSRINRGKIELRPRPVELTALVGRAVEGVSAFLAERQHRLEITLPPEPVWLEADADRLEQVLSNLLNNAGKYTPPGGRIRLTATRVGGVAVVRVKDAGIGIRAEMLPRIFDLFQQADRVPGHVSEGLGLGLTLVRQLVELHGGTVQAHSAGPGHGSEFVVRLPLPDHPVRPEAAETAVAVARPLRVLVVDDNVDGAASLGVVLRRQGNEVRVAHDGQEALAAVAAFRPELVLLDIGLPNGMDGYEVARRLRALPEGGQMRLVALTGYGQDEDRLRSGAAGFAAHLVKPVDLDALRELLARIGADGP